jgi:hypothetical protein
MAARTMLIIAAILALTVPAAAKVQQFPKGFAGRMSRSTA